MSISLKRWKEINLMANQLKMEHKLPKNVEDQIMVAVLQHRKEHEDAAMTIGRLMKLAELKIQEMESLKT